LSGRVVQAVARADRVVLPRWASPRSSGPDALRSGSPTELAKTAGVSLRQLAGYGAGDQQPVLSAAVALADALGISMDQLAGKVTYDLDLSGDW
jgi:hypothetical protein